MPQLNNQKHSSGRSPKPASNSCRRPATKMKREPYYESLMDMTEWCHKHGLCFREQIMKAVEHWMTMTPNRDD